MADRSHPLIRLLEKDRRYSLDAYQFVRDALSYAQDVLHMGDSSGENGGEEEDEPGDAAAEAAGPSAPAAEEFGESQAETSFETPDFQSEEEEFDEGDIPGERHVTGQQLCEAIRRYAIDQYGYMARPVLSSWGINETGDFGEIVYNLIGIGLMKKSSGDRREDFDNVYDFEDAFQRAFEITLPE